MTLSTLSGKKKTGNCEENRSFVECGVNFLDYVYFWFLNKFCIQELSLLYGLIVLKSTTFCTKILWFFIEFSTSKLRLIFSSHYVWFTNIPTKNGPHRPHKQYMVELPDTASGSEKSSWYHSTRIVICFVSSTPQLQITKLWEL